MRNVAARGQKRPRWLLDPHPGPVRHWAGEQLVGPRLGPAPWSCLSRQLCTLIQINAGRIRPTHEISMWYEIRTAPFDRDLELAVMDDNGTHALVFPCRRVLRGWINAETKQRIDVYPTHWREWHRPSA